MDLVCRSSLPLKQGESYVSKCSYAECARKVFSLHISVVSCACSERNSIAPIVSAHTDKISAPADSPFEMVDVRRLQLWSCRLVMTAVLIQPRYGIRISAAIVCAQF